MYILIKPIATQDKYKNMYTVIESYSPNLKITLFAFKKAKTSSSYIKASPRLVLPTTTRLFK